MIGVAAALFLMAAAPADMATAIVGATLVDVSHAGRTTADIDDSVVLVRGGRIVAVGDRAHLPPPAHARIVQAKGRYIVPGLIDGFGAMRTPGFADAYLYEGVTTVYVPLAARDGGIDGEKTVVEPANGLSLLTGAPISGYAPDGSMPRVHPWIDHRLKDRRLDSAALVAAVDAAADAGRRGVTVGFDVWPDQLDVIVGEAHRRGLAVAAELAFTSYPYAVHAGVDAFIRNDKYSLSLSRPQDFLAYADDPQGAGGRPASRAICSGEGLDGAIAAFAGQLADSHAALMPVLSMEATADDVGGPNPWTMRSSAFVTAKDLDDPVDPKTGARAYLDSHPDRREQIRACARRKQAVDGQLHRLGARYLAGTATPSYGVMPGGGLHGELHLLQMIGLTPREALAAATSNFADVYGWTDRGRIEPGRRADLVVLASDPRIDTAAVDDIAQVMVGGRLVDRPALIKAAVSRPRG